MRDFEEYTWLYAEGWSDPDVRWLLSTIPSSMIFDDHDVRDDWNTSAAWRREMQQTSWWEERIIGGLSSYWVYQHLGNLSPKDLADNELYQRVRAHDGDCEQMLREFAAAADKEADGHKGTQWSYRRDLGDVRLLVIDSRCGRVLETGDRSMVSDAEFRWIEEQVEGPYDHLLVGTSLPWLLPRALHDVESWNEVLADGRRGALMARWAEWFRRAADLEHWAAFRQSFDRLAELFRSVGRGDHAGPGGQPPGSICVLSGDVHHAYAARAQYGDDVQSPVYQLTCSPVHNFVPAFMKVVFRISWSRVAEKTMHLPDEQGGAAAPAGARLVAAGRPVLRQRDRHPAARRPVGHAGHREGRPRPRRHRPAHAGGRPAARLTRYRLRARRARPRGRFTTTYAEGCRPPDSSSTSLITLRSAVRWTASRSSRFSSVSSTARPVGRSTLRTRRRKAG